VVEFGNFEGSVVDNLKRAAIVCSAFKESETACNFLANVCAATSYDAQSGGVCSMLNAILPPTEWYESGIYDWPMGRPFLEYRSTFRNVMEEPYIDHPVEKAELLTIYLARFAPNGTFKNLTKLETDFQRCGSRENYRQIWRQFPFNFYSECTFDLEQSRFWDTTDFFEPYFADGSQENPEHPSLVPFPVVIENHRDINGNYPNTNAEQAEWKMARRFFFYDNWTTVSDAGKSGYYQYAKKISLIFEISPSGLSSLWTPHFQITYAQLNAANLRKGVLVSNKEELWHPKFEFSVLYQQNTDTFWRAVLYVFIVAGLLMLSFWLVHSFLVLKSYGYAGLQWRIVIGIIAEFLDGIGVVLFGILLVFGLLYLFFYKWAKPLMILMPPTDEFDVYFPILWTCIGVKTIGVALKLLIASNADFLIIDWDSPEPYNALISNWRRIVVVNEWKKISTIRSYSLVFMLVFVVFAMEGLNVKYSGAPIPSSELIDVGGSSALLRFAVISFMWMVLLVVQILLYNFVIWPFWGDPYLSFIELCKTVNISALCLVLTNHGYYIDGRIGGGAEETTTEWVNMEIGDVESSHDAPGVGKIHEIFLTGEFAGVVQSTFSDMVLDTQRRRKMKHETLEHRVYQGGNELLRGFFGRVRSKNSFIVANEYSFLQLMDFAPDITDDSIFTPVPEKLWKYCGLYGMQISIAIFHLVVFCGIDWASGSSAVSAFVVFFVDELMKLFYRAMCDTGLRTKGLVLSDYGLF
jgi:meckelin